MPLSEFNLMTPKDFNLYVDGFNRRKELDDKNLIMQAYLISRWVWTKNIDIKKVLDFKQEKKVMTDEEMLNQVMALNAIFGGEVKTCNS